VAYEESEPVGPVERELVRMLRSLDLTELQPGVRERCWKEFCELAGLPDSPPAVPSDDLPRLVAELEVPAGGERRGGSVRGVVPARFGFRARPA
jgi:hypothetical protein